MEDEVIIQPGAITEDKPVIKVIGVGGGGTNAANHMYEKGIHNVEFVVCNTDNQSLMNSPVPIKIQLGPDGHGAGNKPEEGRKAAEYSMDRIKEILSDSTQMVFVTSGMGGGTGTGAAPLIAKTAKEMGILTVGIVTIPFKFEGKRRIEQALRGVEEMRESVDSILVISTERINQIYYDCTLRTAFGYADDILATAAKGIAEIITRSGYINVDLQDVKTIMTDSGSAVMGAAKASGKDRALQAIQHSLDSPLLLSTNLTGARNILLNISTGEDGIMVDELSTITDFLQEEVRCDENQIIWGVTESSDLKPEELEVTIVATGFSGEEIEHNMMTKKPNKPNKPESPVVLDYTSTGQSSGTPTNVYNPVNENPRGGNSINNGGIVITNKPTTSPSTSTDTPSGGETIDISKYYPESKGGTKPSPTPSETPTETILKPQDPVVIGDDEDEGAPVANYPLNKHNTFTSNLSFMDGNDLEIDDKNDFLHHNVD